jgi:hypothetical protein
MMSMPSLAGLMDSPVGELLGGITNRLQLVSQTDSNAGRVIWDRTYKVTAGTTYRDRKILHIRDLSGYPAFNFSGRYYEVWPTRYNNPYGSGSYHSQLEKPIYERRSGGKAYLMYNASEEYPWGLYGPDSGSGFAELVAKTWDGPWTNSFFEPLFTNILIEVTNVVQDVYDLYATVDVRFDSGTNAHPVIPGTHFTNNVIWGATDYAVTSGVAQFTIVNSLYPYINNDSPMEYHGTLYPPLATGDMQWMDSNLESLALEFVVMSPEELVKYWKTPIYTEEDFPHDSPPIGPLSLAMPVRAMLLGYLYVNVFSEPSLVDVTIESVYGDVWVQTTPFTLEPIALVGDEFTLTVPDEHEDLPFKHWLLDGSIYPSSTLTVTATTALVTMEARAIYMTGIEVDFRSENPDAGVTNTLHTPDVGGATNAVTPHTNMFFHSIVEFSAPEKSMVTTSEYEFAFWHIEDAKGEAYVHNRTAYLYDDVHTNGMVTATAHYMLPSETWLAIDFGVRASVTPSLEVEFGPGPDRGWNFRIPASAIYETRVGEGALKVDPDTGFPTNTLTIEVTDPWYLGKTEYVFDGWFIEDTFVTTNYLLELAPETYVPWLKTVPTNIYALFSVKTEIGLRVDVDAWKVHNYPGYILYYPAFIEYTPADTNSNTSGNTPFSTGFWRDVETAYFTTSNSYPHPHYDDVHDSFMFWNINNVFTTSDLTVAVNTNDYKSLYANLLAVYCLRMNVYDPPEDSDYQLQILAEYRNRFTGENRTIRGVPFETSVGSDTTPRTFNVGAAFNLDVDVNRFHEDFVFSHFEASIVRWEYYQEEEYEDEETGEIIKSKRMVRLYSDFFQISSTNKFFKDMWIPSAIKIKAVYHSNYIDTYTFPKSDLNVWRWTNDVGGTYGLIYDPLMEYIPISAERGAFTRQFPSAGWCPLGEWHYTRFDSEFTLDEAEWLRIREWNLDAEWTFMIPTNTMPVLRMGTTNEWSSLGSVTLYGDVVDQRTWTTSNNVITTVDIRDYEPIDVPYVRITNWVISATSPSTSDWFAVGYKDVAYAGSLPASLRLSNVVERLDVAKSMTTVAHGLIVAPDYVRETRTVSNVIPHTLEYAEGIYPPRVKNVLYPPSYTEVPWGDAWAALPTASGTITTGAWRDAEANLWILDYDPWQVFAPVSITPGVGLLELHGGGTAITSYWITVTANDIAFAARPGWPGESGGGYWYKNEKLQERFAVKPGGFMTLPLRWPEIVRPDPRYRDYRENEDWGGDLLGTYFNVRTNRADYAFSFFDAELDSVRLYDPPESPKRPVYPTWRTPMFGIRISGGDTWPSLLTMPKFWWDAHSTYAGYDWLLADRNWAGRGYLKFIDPAIGYTLYNVGTVEWRNACSFGWAISPGEWSEPVSGIVLIDYDMED